MYISNHINLLLYIWYINTCASGCGSLRSYYISAVYLESSTSIRR